MDGYTALACAVITDAVTQWRRGDIAAFNWLASEGSNWADAIGIGRGRAWLIRWLLQQPGYMSGRGVFKKVVTVKADGGDMAKRNLALSEVVGLNTGTGEIITLRVEAIVSLERFYSNNPRATMLSLPINLSSLQSLTDGEWEGEGEGEGEGIGE